MSLLAHKSRRPTILASLGAICAAIGPVSDPDSAAHTLSTVTTADELRGAARRARGDADALRAIAAGLDRSAIHDLTRLAGHDTWVGPTAARLEEAVRTARQELSAAADDLRREASLLDQEASDLERAAASAQLALVP